MVNFLVAFTQTIACHNKLDSTQIADLAKSKARFWDKYESTVIQFDEPSCKWTVISTKLSFTNQRRSKNGKCKHTNGCRLQKSMIVVIDANTKKVISKKRKKEYHPNWE